MGGRGSGTSFHWWRASKKNTVEDCLSLDANEWMREGVLKPGAARSGSWRWTSGDGKFFSVHYEADTRDSDGGSVRLWYSWTVVPMGQEDSADYRVALTSTRPHYGGLRWWFLCPLAVSGRPCRRRVGKLHLPPGAGYFGCRNCHGLTYTSCQTSRQFDGVYRHLAWETGEDFAVVKEALEGLRDRRG